MAFLVCDLDARLRRKGVYSSDATLAEERLRRLMKQRIDALDIQTAKIEVLPFVRRPADLDLWSNEYFRHVLRNMLIV